MKKAFTSILVVLAFAFPALADNDSVWDVAKGAPHCTGVVDHRSGMTPEPQKLSQESANAVGLILEGYHFTVQYQDFQLWLTIRDPKNNADYDSVLSEAKSDRKQDLRIRLNDLQLTLSCRQ
jgi:hypothetical protein